MERTRGVRRPLNGRALLIVLVGVGTGACSSAPG
jgi:hypothetical protein